jgi:hypothetical protein
MNSIIKVQRIYKSLQQEHRDLVNRLNNTKGNAELIIYLQKEIDKILPELEWFKRAFENNVIVENEGDEE